MDLFRNRAHGSLAVAQAVNHDIGLEALSKMLSRSSRSAPGIQVHCADHDAEHIGWNKAQLRGAQSNHAHNDAVDAS